MSEQTTTPARRTVQLAEKVFVVSIKYAPGTRWLVDDVVFLKGLQVHCQTTATFSTTGQIPLVEVKQETSQTPVEALLATIKEGGAS